MFLAVVLLSIGLLGASALAAALAWRSDRAALVIGSAGSLLACLVGGGAAATALLRGARGELWWSCSLPLGELHVGLDALSSFFLVCVFLVAGLATLYGSGYLRGHAGERRLAPALAFSNLLIASMAALVVVRDGILFLFVWEVMSLAAFFLVTYRNEREDVLRAGMTYLIASHLGVVCLYLLFALLGRHAGTYDFGRLGAAGSPGLASLCFLLALVGFGAKAGFWPLHIWVPDTYPAAPSHVSALMSGAMSKMGIYGLLRILGFLGTPSSWWGGALLAVGAVSGLVGILHANAQRDLKRRLAYSSVENLGIVAMGIGLGLLGQSHGEPGIAFLGYAGALLHVLNHGLFKGLLFMGAGSVSRGTGTRDLDALGGLARRMPVTAATFLVGCVAISALPPLNGFIGEWLIYVAAFRGGAHLPPPSAVCALAVVPVLALIGGFAVACFTKAYGGVFLGKSRTPAVETAREASGSMRAAMLLCALGCVVIGLWPTGALRLVVPAATVVDGAARVPSEIGASLLAVVRTAGVLLAAMALFAILRRALLRGRPVAQVATWGCGYVEPSPRMQYTATSFAEPLLRPFASVIAARTSQEGPTGFFPQSARYEEHLGDMAGERLLIPAVRRVIGAFSRLRVLQQGSLQIYLVYIAVALGALLVWQLAGAVALP